MTLELGGLHDFLGRARWFGGKGRTFSLGEVRQVGAVGPVAVLLAEVTYDDGERELYQLPVVRYDEPQPHLEHALIGPWDSAGKGGFAYDAVHDREAMAAYLRAFIDPPERAQLVFVRLPGHDLDPDAQASLFSGEQSNSSVFFGEDAVLKLFRKITPGENPDVTTHRALTESGSAHVAALYGWIELSDDAGISHLGMLQPFLRTASDGWDLALASVRNLFAEADLHAEEVGGDFAGEAERLGETLAEIHAQLRVAFPTVEIAAGDLAERMAQRLDAAIEVVPELDAHRAGARELFTAVTGLGQVPAQRIHADLHLGQTLRTVAGWKIVDFEGEPVKPLAERLAPDSPWRDVAGLTRSFDYAPHAVAASLGDVDEDVRHQRAVRAAEWARRNRQAFLASYAGEGGLSSSDRILLTAYVVDKAIYECVYEARNRPTWLSIPVAAVARLTGG